MHGELVLLLQVSFLQTHSFAGNFARVGFEVRQLRSGNFGSL